MVARSFSISRPNTAIVCEKSSMHCCIGFFFPFLFVPLFFFLPRFTKKKKFGTLATMIVYILCLVLCGVSASVLWWLNGHKRMVFLDGPSLLAPKQTRDVFDACMVRVFHGQSSWGRRTVIVHCDSDAFSKKNSSKHISLTLLKDFERRSLDLNPIHYLGETHTLSKWCELYMTQPQPDLSHYRIRIVDGYNATSSYLVVRVDKGDKGLEFHTTHKFYCAREWWSHEKSIPIYVFATSDDVTIDDIMESCPETSVHIRPFSKFHAMMDRSYWEEQTFVPMFGDCWFWLCFAWMACFVTLCFLFI